MRKRTLHRTTGLTVWSIEGTTGRYIACQTNSTRPNPATDLLPFVPRGWRLKDEIAITATTASTRITRINRCLGR